ncbi:hypothetical protein [Streptomyces sp. NPDC101181]|uniref:hypothetical protein n=1 Tax=Streptomyces sp. NPDC101181 TaxID=3366125 RepID=UPI003801B7E8
MVTLSYLPPPPPVSSSREPWPGEAEALEAAAAAGRRAAAWLRSLPAPPDTAEGRALGEELAAAVESVTAGLDPEDDTRAGWDGGMVEGFAGADPWALLVLGAVPCAAPAAHWLTPGQRLRLVAVASLAVGAVRLVAEDPGTALREDLAEVWGLLDHALT